MSEVLSERVAAQQEAAAQRLQARFLCLSRFGHTPQIAKQHLYHSCLHLVTGMAIRILHFDSVCTIVWAVSGRGVHVLKRQ